jgi:putative membrane protein
MIRTCLALTAMFGLSTITLCVTANAADPAHKETPARVTPTATFVQTAVVANLFEVESSKLALERSKSPAIKAFAKRMVDDHSAAGVAITETLNEAKLSAPPFKLDARHQALLDELRAKEGADFDRTYLDMQHKAHADAVELFKGYAVSGDNATLKATAARVLPKLEQHLAQVSQLKATQK